MPEDFDIPDIPDVDGSGGGAGDGGGTGSSRPSGSGRRWPWLVAGLVVGIVGTLFLPDLLAPYLPEALRPHRLRVDGQVLKKRAEGDRLLLTVETDSGAMLATFRRRTAAIDLLVEPGDSVTLGLDRYRPFVEDPGLQGVRKGRDRDGREAAQGDRRSGARGSETGGAAGDGENDAPRETDLPGAGASPDSAPAADTAASGRP